MRLSSSDEEVAASLRWYFRESDGAMGLKSNFAGMVASLEGGGWTPRPSFEVDERRLQAAERARELRQVLDAVPVWACVVLRVAHRYSDGTAKLMAALTVVAREHRRSRSKRGIHDWLERLRTNKESLRRRLWLDFQAEAQDVLEEAFEEFRRARGTIEAQRRIRRTEAARDLG